MLKDKSILKKPHGLMCPQPDQVFEGVNRLDGFVDRVFPPGQFSGRVYVVWLVVRGEVLLGLGVELDHRVGQVL